MSKVNSNNCTQPPSVLRRGRAFASVPNATPAISTVDSCTSIPDQAVRSDASNYRDDSGSVVTVGLNLWFIESFSIVVRILLFERSLRTIRHEL